VPRSALAAPPREQTQAPQEFVPPPKPKQTQSAPTLGARPQAAPSRNSPVPSRNPRASTDPSAAGKRGNGVARAGNDDLPMPTAKLKPFKDPPTGAGARRMPTWVPIVALMLVGVAIAYAIAMSGPDLPTPTTSETRVQPPPPPAPPPEAAKATLVVESTPAGASVTVDGQERGCATPCTLDGLSPTSPLLLRLDKEGFLPWSGLVTPSTTQKRVARLRAAPADASRFASLVLRGDVPAEVLVDGAEVGHVTTAGPLPIAPGTHAITLVGASGAKAELKVTFKPGETVERKVDLR
jgi:hypothetical protein